MRPEPPVRPEPVEGWPPVIARSVSDVAIPLPGVANPRHPGLDPESTGGRSGWIPAFAAKTGVRVNPPFVLSPSKDGPRHCPQRERRGNPDANNRPKSCPSCPSMLASAPLSRRERVGVRAKPPGRLLSKSQYSAVVSPFGAVIKSEYNHGSNPPPDETLYGHGVNISNGIRRRPDLGR